MELKTEVNKEIQIKIAVFGPQDTGKTQIIHTAFTETNFEKEYNATTPANMVVCKEEAIKLAIWDTSGSDLFKTAVRPFLSHAFLGICAVDLSHPINEKDITNHLSNFQALNPKTPIILVGTKTDNILKEKRQEIESEFSLLLSNNLLIIARLITSSATGFGLKTLKKMAFKYAHASFFHIKEEENFNKGTQTFIASSFEKSNFDSSSEAEVSEHHAYIEEHLKKLKQSMSNPTLSTAEKSEAILSFHQALEAQKETFDQLVLNSLYTIMLVAILSLIIGTIGFCVAFACSTWLGPASLFLGIMGSSAVVVSMAGVSAGTYPRGFDFFSPKKEGEASFLSLDENDLDSCALV